MLADAFEALKKYDWGTDLVVLAPIEDAAIAAHDNAGVRQDLETRLIAALNGDLSRDARDYVCRKLAIVGSAAAVPTLAGMLGDKNHSHMARYALERIPAPEAGHALRSALPKVNGKLKIGMISSLGARRDAASVAPFGRLLRDRDPAIARAAAQGLGAIGSSESATLLQAALNSGIADKQAVIDALLACGESLLNVDNQTAALAIYKSLSGDGHGRLVRLAATRGVLACSRKSV